MIDWAGVAVLQGELAPLVGRRGRRVGPPRVVADDGPGPLHRPAGGVDDPAGDRQPLLDDRHAVEVARRDDVAAADNADGSSGPTTSARSLGATSSRHRPWASVLGEPSVKT